MTPDRTVVRWQLVGGACALRPAAERITLVAVNRGVPVGDADAVELAVHELLANALEHGHLGDPSLVIDVEVASGDGGAVIVRVADRAVTGGWWPQCSMRERPHGQADATDGTRGRGLALVAAAAGDLQVVTTDGCTVVEVHLPPLRARPREAG